METEEVLPDTDPQDQLFDDDFTGQWDRLPEFDCPPLTQIPPAGIDIIHRRLGIDMRDDTVTLMKKLAATEWFFRNLAGQRLTFKQVMRGGTMFETMIGKQVAKDAQTEALPDPTKPVDATG